ncbi:hypothetical protein OESDEN_18886 [Oesophagostomum dentatum]|uniref:Uncharacterized protein n=1 Tax=Oesophagostomum dentatum TaxID=61180 RepID=A0A0B1S7Y7_OESDE|nr:hypothetical protein OESDEN_18886 [Oesophagostomum dentatum]
MCGFPSGETSNTAITIRHCQSSYSDSWLRCNYSRSVEECPSVCEKSGGADRKAEVRRAGVECLASSIASQIAPIVYYPTMLCGGKSADGCNDLKEGYRCIIDKNHRSITGIIIGSISAANVPEGYQRIIVNLAVSESSLINTRRRNSPPSMRDSDK